MSMRGVSLLETLIYIALFSILGLGMMTGALYIAGSLGRIQQQALLLDEGTYLLYKLEALLREGIAPLASFESEPSIYLDSGAYIHLASSTLVLTQDKHTDALSSGVLVTDFSVYPSVDQFGNEYALVAFVLTSTRIEYGLRQEFFRTIAVLP